MPGVLAARPRSARRGAVAAAIVVVLLAPLVASVVRKPRSRPFRSPVATVPEARGIRTIHYKATDQTVSTNQGGGRFEAWSTTELWLEYPERMRSEYTSIPSGPNRKLDARGSVRDGDREMVWGGGSLGPRGLRWDYWVGRPEAPVLSADVFTEAGLPESGMCGQPAIGIARLEAPMKRAEDGEDVFGKHVEPGLNGERVVVVTHRKTGDSAFLGTYRTRINAASGLVAGWSYEIRAVSPDSGREFTWTRVVDRVEYNSRLSDSLFGTDPPEGTVVIDAYSPQGLKQTYEWTIETLEAARKQQSPEAWEKTRWMYDTSATSFSRLDVLAPDDRAEIRARLQALGIER